MRDGDQGASPKSLRAHNLALLLRLIARSRTTSRVELAGATDLSKATVSSLVGELIEAGLVRDIGPDPAAVPGRPAGRLTLNPYGPVGIGLQLGADHIAGCLMDLTGRLVTRELRRIDATTHSPRGLVRLAGPVLRRLFDHAMTAGQLVAGVTVTIAGTVTTDVVTTDAVTTEVAGDGTVAWAPELGWRDVDVLGLLDAELRTLDLHGIDLAVAGEVGFAALGERRATPDAHWSGSLYVGGESVLGAVLLDDQGVYRGAAGMAGELGHIPVRRHGARCECGRRGCLELYAGRRAMAEAAGVPAAVPARLLAGDRLGTMLTDGDTAAARAVAAAADALADALLPAQLLLDPAGIVLGGRLGGLGEPLRGRLAKRMHEAGARRVPIRLGTLGPDAALRGAAGSVVDRVIADPTPWLPG